MDRLNRQLGIPQGIALLTTSLLGTGVFIIPAIVASIAGEYSLTSWLLLVLCVLPIAFSFAALGKRYPHAGGPAHLAAKAFGKKAERLTAILFLTVLPVGLPAALGIASGFWQSLFELQSWQVLLIQLGSLALMLLLGLSGAKKVGQIQAVIAIAIVSAVVVLLGLEPPSLALWSPPANSAIIDGQVASALGVMFWCFVGIEAFTHLGEEFKRPERDFPIALICGVLLAGGVYYAASVLVLHHHSYGDELANSQSLPTIFAALLGEKGLWVAAVIGYLACFASINIYVQGFARLIWSLSDEHSHSHPLAKLTSNKVPGRALLVVVGASMLSATVTQWWSLPIEQLIRYANGNFVVVYLISMAAGVVLLNGLWRVVAAISTALCALVLLALGMDASYALSLSVLVLLAQKVRARQLSLQH
ncbi:L-methionine/branched-chain amino acid transporter [Aliagarivorans taiwanensis]|uniref:L-methionine/branched-chain amino acid transporter n=1 Tax=Aliagarivorans taiwanensis TaxID=561966 RepID=UPI0004196F07|nr:L-methionine/branched-chain amino acid transporter [Aliagarivorans taiwanensis]